MFDTIKNFVLDAFKTGNFDVKAFLEILNTLLGEIFGFIEKEEELA